MIAGAAAAWPLALDDPYPGYRRLRERGPVHWLDELGAYLVVSYPEALAVLRGGNWSSDPRTSPRLAARFRLAGFGTDAVARSLLFSDPPEHTRLRAMLSGHFTARAVEHFRGRIAHLAESAFAAHDAAEPLDVMTELAYPIPLALICEILGADAETAAIVRKVAPELAATLDPLADTRAIGEGVRAALWLMFELVPLLAERASRPGEDLISVLSASIGQAPAMAADEVIFAALLLLVAGHETTANLVGNAVLALRSHPRALRRLRGDPALLGPAVEELLRFDSPVQLVGRVASADTELGPLTIEAGQQVLVCLGAANRDPAVFTDPDQIRIGRAGPAHLAFGHGRHFCLGAALARLEAQEILRRLLVMDPGLDKCHAIVERGTSPTFRRLAHLTLRAG